MVRIRVVTITRQQGVAKTTARAYNFVTVGGLMATAKGEQYVEVMLDGEAPLPEVMKLYDCEMSFYPDREKKLAFRVEALRAVAVAAPKAA